MAISQLPKGFESFKGAVRVISLVYQYEYNKGDIEKSKRIRKPIPLPHWKTTSPDVVDNLNKALFDALNGVVYDDDKQVVLVERMCKIWGKENKITLEIEEF